jgi:hypothetical protein
VLKNGTPGSVRGRFGQLAVLPRCAPSAAWRTNDFTISRKRRGHQLQSNRNRHAPFGGCIVVLCRYLLEREDRNAGALTRVFDSDATDLAFSINVQERVLVEVTGLGDVCRPKLDIQGISVLEILNFHGLKELSKNAL